MSTEPAPSQHDTEHYVPSEEELAKNNFSRSVVRLRNEIEAITRLILQDDVDFELLEMSANLFDDSNINRWYKLKQEGLVDITDIYIAVNKHRSKATRKIPLSIEAKCKLILAAYNYRLSTNNAAYYPLSTELVTFIPNNYKVNPKEFRKYYEKFIIAGVSAANKNAEETLSQINEVRSFCDEIYGQLLKKDKFIREGYDHERTKLIEEIKHQRDSFEKIITASFKDLSSAFANFKARKQREITATLGFCSFFSILAISLAIASYFFNYWAYDPNLSDEVVSNYLTHLFIKSIPFLTIEILFIYFFRISLNNYYAARDELLQLEIREALCLFAPKYKAFATNESSSILLKKSEDGSDEITTTSPLSSEGHLEEFAKHIFSPMNSRMNPAPHPLDFLGKVTDAVKKVKK